MKTIKLKNGAEVIAQVKNGDAVYVAALWHEEEYVTWRVDSEGNAYWGHYCGNDRARAMRNLAERALLVTEAAPRSISNDENLPSLLQRQAD